LAAALHLDRTTVVRWEAGRHTTLPYLWPKLATLLGVSKERRQELFADEESPRLSCRVAVKYTARLPWAKWISSHISDQPLPARGDPLPSELRM
jgi:hypothetical protein